MCVVVVLFGSASNARPRSGGAGSRGGSWPGRRIWFDSRRVRLDSDPGHKPEATRSRTNRDGHTSSDERHCDARSNDPRSEGLADADDAEVPSEASGSNESFAGTVPSPV